MTDGTGEKLHILVLNNVNLIKGFLILWYILFYHEVVDDELLSFHGVLSHVVGKQFPHLVALLQCDLLQAYVRTYEAGKLVR